MIACVLPHRTRLRYCAGCKLLPHLHSDGANEDARDPVQAGMAQKGTLCRCGPAQSINDRAARCSQTGAASFQCRGISWKWRAGQNKTTNSYIIEIAI